MQKTVVNFPGVRRIGWIQASSLPSHMVLKKFCGMAIYISVSPTWMKIFGGAKATKTCIKDSIKYSEEVDLVFESLDVVPIHSDVAFVVEDVNRKCYVIGSKEGPMLSIKSNTSTGLAGSESAVSSYTVSHSAIRTCIECYML